MVANRLRTFSEYYGHFLQMLMVKGDLRPRFQLRQVETIHILGRWLEAAPVPYRPEALRPANSPTGEIVKYGSDQAPRQGIQ